MAAFSHPPSLLDSSSPFLSSHQPLINTPTPLLSSHQLPPFSQTSSNVVVADQSQSSSMAITEPDDASVVVDKLENGHHPTRKENKNKRRNYRNGSSLSVSPSKEATEGRNKKQKKSSDGVVKEEEEKPKAAKKKIPQQPPTGYIHVRARRGQATDSHSLAERVRREKISERMKMLQRLVPGCDKVTGKALVLDEIINYVQSLQNQVEFLSMKLASVNPTFCDFAMDVNTLTARPERLNSTALPLPSMPQPQCSTNQATNFGDGYLLDNSASVFLQGQRSNAFSSKDAGSQFWDVEDQRQKFLDPYGFNNNLCSFH